MQPRGVGMQQDRESGCVLQAFAEEPGHGGLLEPTREEQGEPGNVGVLVAEELVRLGCAFIERIGQTQFLGHGLVPGQQLLVGDGPGRIGHAFARLEV